MKKFLPYFILGTVVLLLLLLVYSTQKNNRVFDERISFNKRDKIPYGMYVAYNNLSHIFPGATIIVNKKEPARWDSISRFSDKQALIIIAPSFRADEFEMEKLISFARNGNSVFVSTAILSNSVQNILHCEAPGVYEVLGSLSLNNNLDSFSVSLLKPPFSEEEYGCPGKRFESYFSKYDSGTSTVFGNGIYMLPDFIRLKVGKGSLYFHLTPLAFSNYFLLHERNIDYYNKVLSVIPPDTKKVIWDEYYLYKRYSGNNNGNRSILSVLMSKRSLRAALWLLIILLALYILQEMRRKQRIIPVMAKPRNDSLEFVRTIGRLYHEKKDNKNLGQKMAAYFLEHIRNKYKISTTLLDEDFIMSLQRKTGQPQNIIRRIVFFINNIDETDGISDQQLADFHKELEEFYKMA